MATQLVPVGVWQGQRVFWGGKGISKDRKYPGDGDGSLEDWLDDLDLVPTAEGKGFYVGLWFRWAAKAGVSGNQIIEWAERLKAR